MISRQIALSAALLALLTPIAVALRPRAVVVSFSHAHPLATLAPTAPPGWEVRDTPLGDTELSASETTRTLNFDDFFYKTYRQGRMEVRVFATYWTPGRMDPALVAMHTPDICWVVSGGSIIEKDDARVLPGVGNRDLRPACFRVFEFPRGREEVVFWYSFGGKRVQFADQGASPLLGRLGRFVDTLRITAFGLEAREQIFIRISTNRTIDELVKSDLWPMLAASLLPSGIFEPTN